MSDLKNESDKEKQVSKDELVYELQPPEGGWGYIIAAAVTLTMNVTCQPMCAFGIIFGNFLSTIGDETTGTTMANGIFNTVFSFTGLAANHLLQNYSYRTVGLLGACLFFLGAFSTIFVNSLFQIIISFGVLQGLGFGLLLPAAFSALNCYFNKRLNLIMGLSQAMMVAMQIVAPLLAKMSMDAMGFRGTVALLAALSLNTIPAMMSMEPVERYMIKVPINENDLTEEEKQEMLKQEQPLLNEKVEKLEEGLETPHQKYIASKPRASIISLGERAMSVVTVNKIGALSSSENLSFWQSFKRSMDLSLFKDLIYMNLTIGLSLSFTSDVVFISVLPMNLSMFAVQDVATIMTIFFVSDFISRILFSIVSTVFYIKNRYIFLFGTIFSVVFRFGFILYDTFLWKACMCAALGFLRALVQTPLPLVISEEYPSNFETAFSLYMVVCGVVSLIFGPLMSFVKSYTGSNVMALHLLTLAYAICAISWMFEMIFKKSKKSNNTK